jgi:hypothetical protein
LRAFLLWLSRFDFHNECRGMKFENVKKLVDQLDFESQGYLEVGNPSGLKKQFGAFRTKCVFFFFSSKPDLMLTIPPSLFFLQLHRLP